MHSSSVRAADTGKLRGRRTTPLVAALEPRRLLSSAAGDGSGGGLLLAIATDNLRPARFAHDDLWQSLTVLKRPSANARSYLGVNAGEFAALALDASNLRAALRLAPMEFTADAVRPVEVSLPKPDGGAARFAVVETMVMDPRLAAKFPGIKTYRGQGIDDPTATLRMDLTPQGFHAQVLSPDKTFYIDPYWHRNQGTYASYWRADVEAHPDALALPNDVVIDDVGNEIGGEIEAGGERVGGMAALSSGAQLRTYRTAVAATGEYTQFHGGTVPAGQGAIVTAINRVSGIYERELTVRLQLIANNSSLVYTSTADPYTNNNGTTMLGQNQSNLDTVIGSANYDIGHVFSTGGGGIAGLAVVGRTGLKARGVTGLPTPTGDAFYVDYVAHEMGHQFGANHTFNTSTDSQRNASTAYEPGSGSTIMGYAGITSDDLQENSDPFFHWKSFDEIVTYLDITQPAVGTRTNTGNSVPTVNGGIDRTIPANTPFTLTATGADANGDTLTYSWEQADLGPARRLFDADNGTSPLFRVYNPTVQPTRTFPRLTSILGGTNATGVGGSTTVLAERLPSLARAMDFRVTVRDNRAGGGGVNSDDVVVNVVNTGAGFLITSLNNAATLPSGSTQTVTWNVAGTTANGINAPTVNIRLSTDGGNNFTTLLASNVANDGSETFIVPPIATTAARIKVEPTNNVFFDINNADLTITLPDTVAPGLPDLLPATDTGTSNADDVTNRDNSTAGKSLQFSVPGTIPGATVTLYANDVPVGSATATGATTTITTNGTTDLADGKRAITARQTEPGRAESANSETLAVTVDTAGPRATAVFVAGAAWAMDFRNFLAASGLGEAAFGFRLNAADHADELPWVNLNKVSVRFDEAVGAAANDLAIGAINVSKYTANAVGYDPGSFTATWTLPGTGINSDRLLLDVDADAGTGVTDVAGNTLDGEWVNPASSPSTPGGADAFPSGNGTAGGDFRFRVNVLPGDVDRSGGAVGATDVTQLRNRQSTSTATPGVAPNTYTALHDVNGNGSIDAQDVTLVRARQLTQLPAGEPAAPASAPPGLGGDVVAAPPVPMPMPPEEREPLPRLKRLALDVL